jgi:signal transduction histidine kinase
MATSTTARSLGWLVGSWRALTWRGLGYLLLGLPVTAFAVTIALLTVLAGTALSMTVVGVTVVPMLLNLTRAAAWLERRRCALLRQVAPPQRYPTRDLPPRVRLRTELSDPTTWRDLAWLLIAAPVNLACAVIAAATSTVGLGLITIPVWYRFLPDRQAKLYDSGGVSHVVINSVPAALPWASLGILLVWVAGWLTRGVAVGQARLAAALLGPTSAAGLRRRVAVLTTNRAAAVEGQHREIHRIERDLHDGAQARLVALSADLGLAGETFDEDPEQARILVEHARDSAVLALAELRDLVRGIGPPVLTDRGLPAALESVAARSPIPMTISTHLATRPPATVEAATYFVVCEALANAAKHSGAHLVTVDVHRQGNECVVTVTDDGNGGADPHGSGLRGLADRVAALDGQLSVDSPPGGPTIIRAALPCG